MKKLLLTLAALAAVVSLAAQEKNFIDQNYIEINGRAEREVTPDEIYVNIVINEKDNKGKTSVDQQQRDMFRQLQGLGIDLEKDLAVQDMSSDLQTFLLRKNTVYAAKSYQLKLTTATQLAQVFQQLNGIGISDISIARTALSNIDQLREEVRVEAVQNAQKSARALAGAVGRNLGKALYIQDYGYNNIRAYGSNMLMAKSAVTMEADMARVEQQPQLEFQKIKLEHTVMIRFALN